MEINKTIVFVDKNVDLQKTKRHISDKFKDLRMKKTHPELRIVHYKKFFIPGYLAIVLFRLSHQIKGADIISGLMRNLIFRLNLILHSCELHPGAIIGENVFLVHTTGVVIGDTEIGDNVRIHQNVTIGGTRTNPDRSGRPVILDDVVIYAGAVIVGGITIGAGAVIGANSVVLDDVPAGHMAAGVPARIIKKLL